MFCIIIQYSHSYYSIIHVHGYNIARYLWDNYNYDIYILTDLCSLLSDNVWLHGVVLSVYRSMLFGKIVGTASGFSHFWAGIPKASRYCEPFVSNESSVKWFAHKKEVDDGPCQSFLCCFTVLIHLLLRLSSLGNLCKLRPIPLLVLQSAATQLRWGIAKYLSMYYCRHLINTLYTRVHYRIHLTLRQHLKPQAHKQNF